MFDDLLEQHRQAIDDAELDPMRVNTFRDELALVNFTTYASSTMESNIVEQSLAAINEQFADQPLIRAQLLRSMAATLHTIGARKRAHDAESKALDIRRKWLGDAHPETLRSMVGTVEGLGRQEKIDLLEEAEQMARDAVGLRLAKVARNNSVDGRGKNGGDIQLARGRCTLGRTLFLQGRFNEAEAEFLSGYESCVLARSMNDGTCQRFVKYLVELYETRHRDEPHAGFNDMLRTWQDRLADAPQTRDE